MSASCRWLGVRAQTKATAACDSACAAGVATRPVTLPSACVTE